MKSEGSVDDNPFTRPRSILAFVLVFLAAIKVHEHFIFTVVWLVDQLFVFFIIKSNRKKQLNNAVLTKRRVLNY